MLSKKFIEKHYLSLKKYQKNHEIIFSSLFFLFLILIFFFPVIFQGKTLATSVFSGGVMPNGPYEYKGTHPPVFPVRDPGAFNWQDEPLSQYIGNVMKSGKIPIWNPNMGLGYPILGGIQEGIFFPLNYIVFLFSSELAWDVFILLKIFLAGFFTYLFARRIGLGRIPAYVAGTIFMFNGYTMDYLNMAHYSSEALIPLTLLTGEYFIQKRNVKSFIFYVLALALVILPGMPEATFFVFLIAFLWLIFSLVFLHPEIEKKLKIFCLSVLIYFLSITISAIELLPFIEFLKDSFNSHSGGREVGLHYIPLNTIFSLFSPFVFNPLFGWVSYLSYLGIAPFILSILAVFNWKNLQSKQRKIMIFFLIFAFLALAKCFGAFFINWMGRLPVMDTLTFAKYSIPSIIFSFSILAGIGLTSLMKKEAHWLNLKIFLALGLILTSFFYMLREKSSDLAQHINGADGILGGIYLYLQKKINFKIPSVFFDQNRLSFSLVYFALLLFSIIIIFLIFWLVIINFHQRKKWLSLTVLAFVFLELYLYSLPFLRADRYDTFKKAPFVNFLEKEKNKGETYRIYAQPTVLYPNVSSVFGFQDIRFLLALAEKRYFKFLSEGLNVSSEEIDGIRFTGDYPIDLGNRLLDLMNVKYFITIPPANDPFAEKIIQNSQIINKENVALSSTYLNSRPLSGMMLHAPSKIEFPLLIGEKNKKLSFEYGIAGTGVKGTNGVRFVASYDCGKGEKEVINDLIDPVNDPKYLNWQKVNLDFSDCLGKEAKITFDSEDNGNNAFDHFFVGNFSNDSNDIVYDGEVKIIKNENYLPRVFVVHRAEAISDPEKIFTELKNPDFDIRKEIIVEKNLSDNQLSGNNVPSEDASKATITDYEDEKVKVDVSMENAGFLVLLDQYYPGWKAYVDGKETEIYSTDYTFRSIYLTKGDHQVEFVYDPLSYEAGKYITIVTILFLLALYIFREKIDTKIFKKES